MGGDDVCDITLSWSETFLFDFQRSLCYNLLTYNGKPSHLLSLTAMQPRRYRYVEKLDAIGCDLVFSVGSGAFGCS